MKENQYKILNGYQAGDWVCFLKDGALIISEIRYLYKSTCSEPVCVTNDGDLYLSRVLEHRKKK